MLAPRWMLLLVYPHAVGAAECLVGCLVQGISPFDDDNLAEWDGRGACNGSTAGCTVTAISYPSTSYQGALWASTSGTDGSSACTCNLCDPYPYSDTITYISEDTSLWARIHCYLAASESSGYDVSPCVAAILDTGTLPCVDDVYEPPTIIGQFECQENGIKDLRVSSSWEECAWGGDPHRVQELFPAASASSSTTTTSVAVNTNSCLVGCLVQGISPFDADNLAVWDNRATCDSETIGCAVSAINYPASMFQGALWASSWGDDGSTSCSCNICDPYPWSDTTDYMSEEASLWSRIHCYLAASESSGYDVSPCVAAIVDTETLPCVDDVYEPPTLDQFDCDENAMRDLADSSSWEECIWDGDIRRVQELFPSTPASSSTTATTVAVNTNSCLVGCLVQGISPFDDDSLAVWDNRDTCDSISIGCSVIAINYPSTTYFQGALWASSWGTEGSTSCTCSICDPYPWIDTTDYMSDEKSLWSRIHCFLAGAEVAGYDVSPCVAAIVDTGTLPCVDDVYEPPTVDQFACEETGLAYLTDSSSYEECNWNGDIRMAEELFSATSSASSSATATGAAVNTTTCLVGCLVQGISPFGDESRAVWDNRATCDSATIGCAVSAINYPSAYFEGALWASSSGADGSSGCTCSICDPYAGGDTASYMSQESLWSRIHCYLAASEASGYDVSPCVAAIVDTGTLPCVGDVYEPPTLDHFDCEENGITDLADASPLEECLWDEEYRSTDEFYGGTRAPSPHAGIAPTEAPDPTPAATSSTPPPIEGGAASPTELEHGSCAVGSPCSDNFCCHPDTSSCGRKYTFCQERDFPDGPRCCSGVDGDPSASNVCSEDSICDEPEGLTRAEVAGIYIGICTGVISIAVAVWKGYKWCKGGRKEKDPSSDGHQQHGNVLSGVKF